MKMAMGEILFVSGIFFIITIVILLLIIRYISEKILERIEHLEERISSLSEMNKLLHTKQLCENIGKLKEAIEKIEKETLETQKR
jgi:predicted Holliday junction resolvase-like endonuclease